jgi:hypothetical protein
MEFAARGEVSLDENPGSITAGDLIERLLQITRVIAGGYMIVTGTR